MQHIQDKIAAALKDAHVVSAPYDHLIGDTNPTLSTLAKSYRDWYITAQLCEEIEEDRAEFRKREKAYLSRTIEQAHDTLRAFELTMKTIDPTVDEVGPAYQTGVVRVDESGWGYEVQSGTQIKARANKAQAGIYCPQCDQSFKPPGCSQHGTNNSSREYA